MNSEQSMMKQRFIVVLVKQGEAQKWNGECDSTNAEQKHEAAARCAIVDAVVESAFWIGEPAPAARRFQSEGMTHQTLH